MQDVSKVGSFNEPAFLLSFLPRMNSKPPCSRSCCRFSVIIHGRFWVTAEVVRQVGEDRGSCPLFLRHQFIRPTQYDLIRQVPALLFAQRAGYNYRLERELLHPGRDIPAIVFAGDDKLLALLHHKSRDRSSIGEVVTKVYTREPGESAGSFEM